MFSIGYTYWLLSAHLLWLLVTGYWLPAITGYNKLVLPTGSWRYYLQFPTDPWTLWTPLVIACALWGPLVLSCGLWVSLGGPAV